MSSLFTKEPLNTGVKGKISGHYVNKRYLPFLVPFHVSVLWGVYCTNNYMIESAILRLEWC